MQHEHNSRAPWSNGLHTNFHGVTIIVSGLGVRGIVVASDFHTQLLLLLNLDQRDVCDVV